MADIKEEFEKADPQKSAEESVGAEKELGEHKERLPSPEVESHEKLRQEIEAMDVNDGLKPQVSQTAQDIKSNTPEEKIKKLLLIAQQKGVVYAVNVAKKMDDPYVLDMLHDALAKEGLYKKFKQ